MEPTPTEEPAVEPSQAAVPEQRTPEPVAASPLEPLVPLVPSTPPAAVVRKAQSGSRSPLWLAIAVGVVSLLCVAGLGVGYEYYNKSTAPNRSSPDVVVDNYLQAVLVNQSDSEAAQYVCQRPANASALKAFRNQFVSRETSLGGTATFTWQVGAVRRSGRQASVDATVFVVTSGGSSLPGKSVHEWAFETVDQSGWRVCAAIQLN
ncbi:MAG TPA: hypothetical protein VGJ28_11865 [Micromonosporaceae bacterium]